MKGSNLNTRRRHIDRKAEQIDRQLVNSQVRLGAYSPDNPVLFALIITLCSEPLLVTYA